MKQNKIAITGGIGSGKSTVARIIRSLGYPVYSADEEYTLVLRDQTVLEKIGKAFPVVKDGVLDRKALSEIVFSDKEALMRLNKITHPVIMEKLLSKMTEEISFAEVPLLFEGKYESLFDNVIVVMRPLPQRVSSVTERSHISEKEVLDRIQNQFDYANNDLSAHTIIENNGDLSLLEDEVKTALEKILRSS